VLFIAAGKQESGIGNRNLGIARKHIFTKPPNPACPLLPQGIPEKQKKSQSTHSKTSYL